VAEDGRFIDRYLSKTFGRTDLPADCLEIFGCPGCDPHVLPGPSADADEDPRAVVGEWRNRVRELAVKA
jgi:hypothetical protein